MRSKRDLSRKIVRQITNVLAVAVILAQLSICAFADDSVCEHVYDTVIVDATEDTAGSITYTCIYCGNTYTEAIPATGHSWGAWEITTAPTCTEKGIRTRTCTNNGSHTETQEVPPLGHDYGNWIVDVQPTWNAAGHRYKVCSRDESHIIEETIPKLSVPGGGTGDDGSQQENQSATENDSSDAASNNSSDAVSDDRQQWDSDKNTEDNEPELVPGDMNFPSSGFRPNALDYALSATALSLTGCFGAAILSQLKVFRWDQKLRAENQARMKAEQEGWAGWKQKKGWKKP